MQIRHLRVISYNGITYVGKIERDDNYVYLMHPMRLEQYGLKPEKDVQLIFEGAFVKDKGEPAVSVVKEYERLHPRYFSELLRKTA